jgi:transposase
MARPLFQYRLFVGIDVAATTCAVSWMYPGSQPARAITIKQTPAGFADLQRQLLAIEPDPNAVLIVMEATGSYWMRLAKSLSEAGLAVSVINPAQAHDFAKARATKRSKTDAIDAQTLAELGARLLPERWTPPPHVYTELAQRLVHRDGLLAARTQFRNQLHALMQQPIVIESVRRRLESLIATLEQEIATAVVLTLAHPANHMRREAHLRYDRLGGGAARVRGANVSSSSCHASMRSSRKSRSA